MATKPVEIEILMRDRLSGGLDKAGRKVDELKVKTGSASAEMARLDRQAESVRGTVSKIAGAFAVKELVSNIVKVRGEFQQLEASFNTMLGSEEKADALMQQLIRTAATTPFDLQSVAGGARQLLAYGENVENVNEDLIRLGNIAAGLNQPLSDLIYLYGTTMTQGRLYTADYNQFVGRGIPLGRELANVLGVAEGKVREMVEAGKVGFPEVQQALQNLTNEGGMFYNLMEEQSKTITGRISNIEDSVSMMMNEIGRQSEGIIGNSLDAVAYLVDHYEQVGRVLLGLVGTYGAYKTAVMAVTAMQALQTAGVGALTVAETLHYGWLVIVEKAQKLLNATMLANPYVLVATLVAGVVAAMVSMKTETERLKEAEEEYQATKRKTIEAEEEHRRRLEELCGVAGDESLATDTRREALNKLEQKYPDIFAKYDTEYEKLKNIKRIKEEIAELEAGQSITRPQNELAGVNERISELERKKATERWEDANGSGTRMRKVGGLTGDEATELQNLYNKRKALSEQVRKERANSYFENLTGISNDTLEQQIRQRENLLARMTTEQKKYGNITYGNEALRGTFSRDELQYQLNKLNAEKNRRNLKRDSSADWGAQARKEYEQALKAYNDFLADTSNSLTQEEYEKKAKELKDALSLAKKEYDRYKPDENKDAESERKAADKAEREAERRRQAKEELGRELVELQHSNDEAETGAMEEGLEKKLRQIDDDYQARADEIAKMEAKWKRRNREAGLETGTDGLTDAQRTALGDAGDRNAEAKRKAEQAAYQSEFEAMQADILRIAAYNGETERLREEHWKSEQEAIDRMKEGSDKRLRQIRLDYERELAEIEAQEKRLREAQGGSLTADQRNGIVQSYAEAHGRMEQGVRGVESTEVSRGKERYEALLEQYRTFDQRRRDIDEKYREDMAVYESERARLSGAGGDTSEVEASISARTEKYKEEIASLESDILRASDFYAKLFGDVSEKGYKVLSDFYAQAQETLSGAKIGSNGVTLSVPAKDASGNFVKKQVTVTVAEFERMQKRVKEIRKELEKGNPFTAFKTSYDELLKAVKNGGDVSGALKSMNEKGKELTSTIRGWGDSLGAVFGDRFSQSIGEMMTFVDGMMDMGTGIGQIFSGDIVGGVTGVLGGLSSIVSLFTSWKEKMEEMKREWYIAEIETNRAIRERSEEYAANQSQISDIIKDVELLNWLVEKGYAKPASVSVWEAQSEQLAQYQKDLAAEAAAYDELWGKLQASDAHWEWGNSLNGGSVTHSLRGMSAEQIELYYNQNKLSDAARDYYEAWVDSGKTVEELKQNIEECYATMQEMVMGVSFYSFLSNARDALREMRGDVSKLGEFTEDTLSEAVLNAFMYKDLAKVLEPLYDELSEAFINGTADKDYLAGWRRRFEDAMTAAGERLDAMADAAGVDLDSESGTSQSGKSGSFNAMSQEQGTKLEGMFTSGLMHWSSMDEKMSDVSEQMGAAVDSLRRIEENTGNSARHLGEIKEDIKKIIRDGLKMK